MINESDLISIGVIKRTHYKDLPDFIFVRRDGLFVPFRSETVSELRGEEGFVLKGDMAVDEEEMAWVDFEGWTVVEGDTTIGTIVRVDDSTMNVLFIVGRPDGSVCFIPAQEVFIQDIILYKNIQKDNFM